MFGITKNNSCGDKLHKKNYCGVCKAIGKTYSSKARITLNSDIVFLSMILDEISKKGNSIKEWSGFKTDNCFTIPESNEIPLAIDYTSTINIILVELMFLDKKQDSKMFYSIFWDLSKATFSNEFKKAHEKLSRWNINFDTFLYWSNMQKIRENQLFNDFHSWKDALNYYSQPTATLTGEVLKQGALLLKNKDEIQKLYEIGYNFGKLIYIIDAFEDYNNDFKSNSFNAIRKAFKLEINELSSKHRIRVTNLLKGILTNISNSIKDLDLTEVRKEYYINNLFFSLNEKLKPAKSNSFKIYIFLKSVSQRISAYIKFNLNRKHKLQSEYLYTDPCCCAGAIAGGLCCNDCCNGNSSSGGGGYDDTYY